MIGGRLALRRLAVIGGALVGASLVAVQVALAGDTLTAENAWVPWAPPAVKVHVAYMTIVNRGATDQVVVSGESADYERVELHRSTVKDGVSTMQAVEKVTVPANRRVEFAPTGLHLMLVGPKRPQAVDGHVPIVLHLGDGKRVDVSAVVRRRQDSGHGAHSHH